MDELGLAIKKNEEEILYYTGDLAPGQIAQS